MKNLNVETSSQFDPLGTESTAFLGAKLIIGLERLMCITGTTKELGHIKGQIKAWLELEK